MAIAWQNLLICIEMFVAAAALLYCFPYTIYKVKVYLTLTPYLYILRIAMYTLFIYITYCYVHLVYIYYVLLFTPCLYILRIAMKAAEGPAAAEGVVPTVANTTSPVWDNFKSVR